MHDKCVESKQYLAQLKNTNTVPALWPLSHDKVLVRSKTLKVLGSPGEELYNIGYTGMCHPTAFYFLSPKFRT